MTDTTGGLWTALPDSRARCSVCYRKCEIADGRAGWCRYRLNVGGNLTTPYRGTLMGLARDMLGLRGDAPFLPGELAVLVTLTHCNAACRFCINRTPFLDLDSLPEGRQPLAVSPDRPFPRMQGQRRVLSGKEVVQIASAAGARWITVSGGEPTLSLEWLLELGQQAKDAGLGLFLFSNGYTDPAAIRKLAPYVGGVQIGIKGSLDATFLSEWCQAPGAAEAVKRALLTWRDAGVWLCVSNVLAPPRMQTTDAFHRADEALYTWIATVLGKHTPLAIYAMAELDRPLTMAQILGKPNPGVSQRVFAASFRAEELLPYFADMLSGLGQVVYRCHACGDDLLTFYTKECCKGPCRMFTQYCPNWSLKQHVTPDGRCRTCHAQTPIRVLSRERLKEARDAVRRLQGATAAVPTV